MIVKLPNDPAVCAQFVSSLKNVRMIEEGLFSLPAVSEKAVWAWINSVKGKSKTKQTSSSSS
ncbi:MAG: hypothetical protein GX088_04065 [Clostridia bacterium]|nr:hypothetical protein [Clostridia bacterium]